MVEIEGTETCDDFLIVFSVTCCKLCSHDWWWIWIGVAWNRFIWPNVWQDWLGITKVALKDFRRGCSERWLVVFIGWITISMITVICDWMMDMTRLFATFRAFDRRLTRRYHRLVRADISNCSNQRRARLNSNSVIMILGVSTCSESASSETDENGTYKFPEWSRIYWIYSMLWAMT